MLASFLSSCCHWILTSNEKVLEEYTDKKEFSICWEACLLSRKRDIGLDRLPTKTEEHHHPKNKSSKKQAVVIIMEIKNGSVELKDSMHFTAAMRVFWNSV
ncbi:hypothetical protein K0M31_011112 [Melipona bicolor]|uniref:Uncharacterized protein n=1 Tax=Melipona bicolor TaxID=60889 RepID=A0AA40KUB4_9HYME|nr:hypothetical protein K0M31_011112 [Melipona bicolor]